MKIIDQHRKMRVITLTSVKKLAKKRLQNMNYCIGEPKLKISAEVEVSRVDS